MPYVELHVIQSFAPSLLNRGDDGSPKDCWFGGGRRLRVSSQCWKRAIRGQLSAAGHSTGVRTRLILDQLVTALVQRGRDAEVANRVVRAGLSAVGFGFSAEAPRQTQTLLFLGRDEIAELARVMSLAEIWDVLAETPADPEATKKSKRAAEGTREAREALLDVLTIGSQAVDLALFGRMVADRTEAAVDGACQVAHAITTHAVSTELDYWTSVDDLALDDQPGAAHLGETQFAAGVYYRYLTVDADVLRANLAGSAAHAVEALAAFLEAAVVAVPSGKQHAFAAQSQPSLILAVARSRGPLWSLSNAFHRPVRASEAEGDIILASTRRLDSLWGGLVRVYGDQTVIGTWGAVTEPTSPWYAKDQTDENLTAAMPFMAPVPSSLAELVSAASGAVASEWTRRT